MKKILHIFIGSLILAAGSCTLEGPEERLGVSDKVELSGTRMRIITKNGDMAESFNPGTVYRLFAVNMENGAYDWENATMYDKPGTETDEHDIDYGEQVSYPAGKTLDFYGVTFGTEDAVPVTTGGAPSVHMQNPPFKDLMWSDNLKQRNATYGKLTMEYRHALSKISFEVMKQDESDEKPQNRRLKGVRITRIEMLNTIDEGVFDIVSGSWSGGSLSKDTVVFLANDEGVKLDSIPDAITDGSGNPKEVLVIPSEAYSISQETEYPKVRICLKWPDGASLPPGTKTDVTFPLQDSEGNPFRFLSNHSYKLSVIVMKNDIRVVTVSPQVYDWIDVDFEGVAVNPDQEVYLGQPVFFGGLMWMDRNLGAKSADCENDWWNSIGYYYQFGRNVPYILDVDKFLSLSSNDVSLSFKGYTKDGSNLSPAVSSSSYIPNAENYWDMRAIYALDENGNRITLAYYANHPSGAYLYDKLAKNPGEDLEYSYIMGIADPNKKIGNRTRTWAITGLNNTGSNYDDTKNENHTYWSEPANQPCPTGWRMPTMKDLFSFMPEHENLYWLDSFTKGDDMREHVKDGSTIIIYRNYGEGNKNIAGEEYEWKYFAGKFKIDDAAGQDEALTYPKKDTYGRVYGIKYEGTEKAYRVMFEQKPYIKDGVAQTNKTFARISRFDTEPTDRFEISADGRQWNIHKFDWSTPAEIMDIPLSGYMYDGGITEVGTAAILRASDPSTTRGNNYTLYLRSGSNGVTVTQNTRRLLGENIRCVRDVEAK